MSTVQFDSSTPASGSHTVSSSVSGNVTIEVWGSGSGGYYSNGYGGGGGAYAKGVFTIVGGTRLDYVIPPGGITSDGQQASVQDSLNSGIDVAISAQGGSLSGVGGGANYSGSSGNFLVIGSEIKSSGGAGGSDGGGVGGGGGSSGCPTADGLNGGFGGDGGAGGASAGVDSGAGGAGSFGVAGGGGGAIDASVDGNGGNGRVKISYNVTANVGPDYSNPIQLPTTNAVCAIDQTDLTYHTFNHRRRE